eukprot:CAMPEP_0183554718 /NCGR_PEP_ID=MMETSP0371-20130417/79025_1 /TAXON_ID=268820 /ORGANISM="Peridinium aciculiferum, Strain PAER-2" /LENGTH=44 /DNA_ID= /DNA_START= /DNA_END= /DNA_ORIENTATION=
MKLRGYTVGVFSRHPPRALAGPAESAAVQAVDLLSVQRSWVTAP